MNTYNHYIALDWAQKIMAIARMTEKSNKLEEFEGPSSVKDLKVFLNRLRGTKILTIEESTASQWLYTELKEHVDELVICDPYRNHLLSEGAKTDKIDARKLVTLLRANLVKPVFHSTDDLIRLRKLISGYRDLIQFGVRLKNQRSALYRARGLDTNENSLPALTEPSEIFVLNGLNKRIEIYEQEKELYVERFATIAKSTPAVRLLKTLPGIKDILAVQILAVVVDPNRFPTSGHFLSYCGLVMLDRMSGGKCYGKVRPRYSRTLKNVFKTAASSNIGDCKDNPMALYYRHLVEERGYPPHKAKHAVARRIAVLAWGILKTKKKYNPDLRSVCKAS